MLAIICWLAVGSNPTTRFIASLAECALYGKMAVENQGCECVGGIKVCKKRLFPNAPILGRKEKTMRPIDADALKEALNNWAVDLTKSKFPHYIKDDADCIIDNAPTIDAVPVVRCKDCVYGTDRTEDFQEEGERWYVVNPIDCMMYSSDGEPDFFPKDNYCGFGKRRNDEERRDDDKSCDTCKHHDKEWDDIVCDGCTKAHSNWERRDDE